MAVPNTPHYRKALDKGDTIGYRNRPHVHWIENKMKWLVDQPYVVGVEIDEEAVPLPEVAPATTRTVILLGHEGHGIPLEAKPAKR